MSHVKMGYPSLAIVHKRERAVRAVVLPEAASSADIFLPYAYFHARLPTTYNWDCFFLSFLFHLGEGYLAASWLVPAYGAARGMGFSALSS